MLMFPEARHIAPPPGQSALVAQGLPTLLPPKQTGDAKPQLVPVSRSCPPHGLAAAMKHASAAGLPARIVYLNEGATVFSWL